MNYPLQNRVKQPNFLKPLSGLFLIIAIASFFYFFAPNFASKQIHKLATIIWSGRNYTNNLFQDLYSIVKNKQSLRQENILLQSEIGEAKIALLELDIYKNENTELKKLLGRDQNEKRILATILEKPNRSLYDTLIIDVGKNQQIEVGDSILSGNFIIGTVVEVHENHSKASLLSTPETRYTVRIGESPIESEAFGRGNGNFIAKLPKEISVNNGDLVRFIGLSIKFLGRVEVIEKTEADPFQVIFFTLPVNIQNLTWVEVVKKQ